MNSWLFLNLFMAHIIGDFYCQNDKLCEQKEALKTKSLFLYIHALTIGALSYFVVQQEAFIWYAVIIALSHLVIDLIKAYLCPSFWTFLTDQLLHLIVLFVITRLYDIPDKLPLQMLGHFHSISIPLLAIGLLLCVKPTNILIKFILKRYQIGESTACNDIKNAGALIGNLERVLTILFVLIGQYDAIGFIIASKSLLRFKETDTAKTEYVLAGTFLSFGIAVIIGLLIRYLSVYF